MTRNMIAILRGVRPDEAVDMASVLLGSGITKIEVPLNSPNPFESIERIVHAFGDQALIGAGTVLEVEEVHRVHDIGGKLVVSPNCDPAVIKATKMAGLLSYPGVMTPSECFAALRAGADGLKFFPGNLIGPAGMKAIRAVLPRETEVLAVGGAGPENFAEWKEAGANGFGIGSALYKPGSSLADVQSRAAHIVALYDQVYAT